MFAILREKLRGAWRVLTARSIVLISQSAAGEEPNVQNFGGGNIQDMVLVAVAMQRCHIDFVEIINIMATESGELHALQEIRAAVATLEEAQ